MMRNRKVKIPYDSQIVLDAMSKGDATLVMDNESATQVNVLDTEEQAETTVPLPKVIASIAGSDPSGALPKSVGFLVVVVKSGQGAIYHMDSDTLMFSKVFRRYMVRKSQGKSQLKYLKTKGKSRLGSRIRLRETRLFFQELTGCIDHIMKDHGERIQKVFMACDPGTKGYWWSEFPPTRLPLKDSRMEKIPFHVDNPTEEIMDRVVFKLYQPQSVF